MENEAEKKEGDSKSDDKKTDEKTKQHPPKSPEEERVKKQKDEPHKDAKQPPQGATVAQKKFQRAKAEAPTGSACMPFCGNEPPPAKRKRRSQSRERKEALNRGASKERECKQREAAAAAAAAAMENAPKRHLRGKHPQIAHQIMDKRQEKPISFIDCTICHKVFNNAVEIECGHVFCNACLRRKMGRHKRCPTCKSEIEYIHPCYIVRELVEKFGVKDGPKKLKAELLQVSGYYDEYAFEDPIIVASQFIPEPGAGCCSIAGAFDPADLHKIARLEEYVSVEEYLDTIKMVNHIVASWAPGSFGACFGSICGCFMPSQAQKAVNMIEVVLGDCNLRWPETGIFWTLMFTDGDTRSARFLGDRFYLAMRIDRAKARAYQSTLRASTLKKDAEMARLRKQNALMRHKMLELGENGFIRSLAGRKSPRYSLKTGPSLMFVEEYPDYPVISPHTLRDLVLHNPASKRFFISPWNRIRSTSTGPLPLNSAEDYWMRSQLHSVVTSRSPSPYVDRSQRSPSPATSRLNSPGERSRPWR